jgi:Ca-activated chloride channel family protein
MIFGNENVFWLILAWPVLVILGWSAIRWRRQVSETIGDTEQLNRLYPQSIRVWRVRRLFLVLLTCLILIFAAARPQYGRIERKIRSQGVNVLIALDCSKSMGAKDVIPTRIERAKQSLGILVNHLAGNRVGIVAFAGTAVLQCPMTLDRNMAMLMMDALDTETVGVPGTDLGFAIDTAVEAFERGADDGGRVLVLITDGEDHENSVSGALDRAKAAGVRIYAIGIGTARGAPLQDQGGQFMETVDGPKVNTRMQMDSLKRISEFTGGTALEAGSTPEHVVRAIADRISRQEKADLEERKEVIHMDRFQWFLIPALLILFWMLLRRPEATDVNRTASKPST